VEVDHAESLASRTIGHLSLNLKATDRASALLFEPLLDAACVRGPTSVVEHAVRRRAGASSARFRSKTMHISCRCVCKPSAACTLDKRTPPFELPPSLCQPARGRDTKKGGSKGRGRARTRMEHVFARKVDHAIRGSILKLAYVTLVLADALPRHCVANVRRHCSPPPPPPRPHARGCLPLQPRADLSQGWHVRQRTQHACCRGARGKQLNKACRTWSLAKRPHSAIRHPALHHILV